MTTKRKSDKTQGARKLKFEKETLRDLDAKERASKIKGGIRPTTRIQG
ncbi:MAG TPA: hypothetical protein VJA66_07950 [Thermoanaerobaculia bacterium]